MIINILKIISMSVLCDEELNTLTVDAESQGVSRHGIVKFAML